MHASNLPARLGRDVTAALVVSLAAVSFYMSAASLIFQGPLAPHLATGIGAALVSGAVLSVFAGWRGSMPLASAGPEPSAVPVLAAIAAGIAAQAPAAAVLPTTVAALAATTLAIGAAWWLMGRRRWGDLIRFIPYPVIGGFLGSVGWLMATGGLGVATGETFGLATAWRWLTGASALAAAGLAIGLAVWAVTTRVKHVLALPAVLVAAALAVHAGLWAAGIGTDAARALGWLMPALGRVLPAWPADPALLAAVDWGVLASEAGLMLSAVIVATFGLLLSATSLEVAWDQRADLNRDLVTLGQGHVATALAGGFTGGISISRSLLNQAAGAAGRGSSIALAMVCGAVALWGSALIAWVPRPLLGGVLVYLGLAVLKTWLVDSRRRLARTDHATVVLMVAITAVAGFLPAVCVGVLACCVGFAVASARLAPVRRLVPRSAWPGRSERTAQQAEYLRGSGARQLIVELQGVLFFGSATQLVRQVEALLAGPLPPERLLFDLRQVRWLDSSAAQAMARLFKQAGRQGVRVDLSALPAPARQALAAAGALGAGGPALHDDIDGAVSLWEDEALAAAGIAMPSLDATLAQSLGTPAAAAELLAHFERITLAPGERLFSQGDVADALYLVHSGRLATLVGEGDAVVAVRTTHAGGTIGEMGLFRAARRTATLRAEAPTVLLRLSKDRLDALEREHPALASALYRHFLRQLAGRLDQSTAQATALAR